MFVTIRRAGSDSILKVSAGQYRNKYEKLGYYIVGGSMKKSEPKVEEETEQVVEDVEETEDVDSIPISEMNKEQLMEYAKEHNINTKGARNVAEARKIIQRAVKEAKM